MLELYMRHAEASSQTGLLTEDGRAQAIAAGEYIRARFPGRFTHGFHSPSRRAVDTANLLSIPSVVWVEDGRLTEMSWGSGGFPKDFEQLKQAAAYRSVDWAQSPDGESWQAVLDRVAHACNYIEQVCKTEDRIIVSHGNAMHAIRASKEGFTGDAFRKVFEAPYKYFGNCQAVIYSNEDPETGAIHSSRRWVTSVCPWNLNGPGHGWIPATI